MNKFMIIGRLGKDPEIRTTASGKQLATFSVATSEKYADKQGNRKESTEWHNVVVWGKLAEICSQYLRKGSQAMFEGKITYEEYEKDGVKKSITKLVASNMEMLDSKKELAGNRTDTDNTDRNESDLDLPF